MNKNISQLERYGAPHQPRPHLKIRRMRLRLKKMKEIVKKGELKTEKESQT